MDTSAAGVFRNLWRIYMLVTTADFHANMDKYLTLVHHEDIVITADGKPIAQMTAPKTSAVDSLRGLLKGLDTTMDDIRAERLSLYENTM